MIALELLGVATHTWHRCRHQRTSLKLRWWGYTIEWSFMLMQHTA